MLDVSLWQQKNSITAHLVNLTNPMMMKGPFRELFPVGKQIVRLRLPPGLAAKKVRLLTAGTEPAWRSAGEGIEVEVPSVELHEIVAVDTA